MRTAMTERKWVTLIYDGPVPRMNVQTPNYWHRWNLKKRALKQFGVLPVDCQKPAYVTITRVLGPRQHMMDDDNLRYALKGLRDALTAGQWIVDNSPQWTTFDYRQSGTRRDVGPRIEVLIQYIEHGKESPR